MSGSKIKTSQRLAGILRKRQKQGDKVVFTNGCFDLLHRGHVQYLEAARNKGNCLVVGMNTDASIRRLKGPQRPLVPLADRARVIAALESVDFVVPFSEDTPEKLIRLLKPDLLVKGADWKHKGIVGADFVVSYGGKVCTIPLAKGRSTTNLIEKIVKTYARNR